MKQSEIKHLTIDALNFARNQRHIQGKTALADLARVCEDLPEQDAQSVVQWSLQGSVSARGQALLELKFEANPWVQCQRCMQPFRLELRGDNTLAVVKSEQDLNVELSDSGEVMSEAVDKILGSPHFDVIALLEDELILSLPYVPKHEVCPDQVELPEDTLEKRVSPFAVLKKLKH